MAPGVVPAIVAASATLLPPSFVRTTAARWSWGSHCSASRTRSRSLAEYGSSDSAPTADARETGLELGKHLRSLLQPNVRPAAAAHLVDARAMRDRVDPGHRVGAFDVRAARGVQLQEGLLQEVVGRGCVAHEASQVRAQAGRHLRVEALERSLPPVAIVTHQFRRAHGRTPPSRPRGPSALAARLLWG